MKVGICFFVFKKINSSKTKILLDRKALETALQEDLDTDEENALNLVETDGMLGRLLRIGLRANISFLNIDDVWDDDSAYMELLAEQVNYPPIPFSK